MVWYCIVLYCIALFYILYCLALCFVVGGLENVVDKLGNRVPCSVSVSCVRSCAREMCLRCRVCSESFSCCSCCSCCPTGVPQLLRCLNNLRIGRLRSESTSRVHLSPSPSLAVVGSGGVENALVPADDDPPARSVPPTSAIFRRSTKANQTQSVQWQCLHEFQQRDISALVWKSADGSCNVSTHLCAGLPICGSVAVTMMCAWSSSNRPRQQPLSQPQSPLGSCVLCEAMGYGIGPVHRTKEAQRCTRPAMSRLHHAMRQSPQHQLQVQVWLGPCVDARSHTSKEHSARSPPCCCVIG